MNSLLRYLPQLIAAAGLMGCDRLHKGQSAANESPVPDGCIVLVREGSHRGAFILSNQRTTPETTDVQWFARSDAGGKLVPTDPSVATGKANGVKEVSFPCFAIDWSINTNGKGWVYFSVLSTDIKSPPKYEMCVTDETDITRVDANDQKWIYRERPSVNPTAFIKP
jgi:hypothetical protein